jgi:prolyl-tRNA synthetase
MKDFVIGANERDHHFVGMNWEDIFSSPAEKDRVKIVGDFRQVAEGDLSPEGQPLRFKTAIELGHIFKLNLRYSEPMKALYADESGALKPIVMGCYGIGVNRILAAAIEQHGDDKGIAWPKNIAPFQVLVTMIDFKDAATRSIVDNLFNSKELADKNVDILADDRDATAGIKFNDADLIGIPIRVTLGPKNLANHKAEIKVRKTGHVELVDLNELVPAIIRHLDNLA